MSEFNYERLCAWGEALKREGNSLGESLLDYANAWYAALAERDALLVALEACEGERDAAQEHIEVLRRNISKNSDADRLIRDERDAARSALLAAERARLRELAGKVTRAEWASGCYAGPDNEEGDCYLTTVDPGADLGCPVLTFESSDGSEQEIHDAAYLAHAANLALALDAALAESEARVLAAETSKRQAIEALLLASVRRKAAERERDDLLARLRRIAAQYARGVGVGNGTIREALEDIAPAKEKP